MGTCSSAPKHKPGNVAPQKPGEGFGSGTGGQASQPTGEINKLLLNSLPPSAVAEHIKALHPAKGGPPEGLEVLRNLYVATKYLGEQARKNPEYRYLEKSKLGSSPHALAIATWLGFKEHAAQPSMLTAEEVVATGTPAAFVCKRTADELRTALQYMEAMLG
eukprot:Sspe_Gene.116974::Locus_107187_Transcript_1_1_Confidence_1.000_Length_524::g.116974::m.116974